MSLLPFVPKLALRLLRDTPALSDGSRGTALQASVLMADVSGFTGLVDTLATQYGDRGAEHLQEVLNRCFGRLTDIVDAAGGEVLSFPGDAAIALWTAPDGDDGALAGLVDHCARCGLELQAALDRFPALDGLELRLRVAVGAGRSWAALIGGVDGHWATILQGDGLDQLNDALQTARAGEVVLSPAAGGLLGVGLKAERRGTHFVLAAAQTPSVRSAWSAEPAIAVEDAVVRALVPAPVLTRVDAGLRAWLAEFRDVTVVFVRLHHGSGPRADHTRLQNAIRLAQSVAGRFEGSVNQVVADEKGLTVVLGFGVGQRAHEDDPLRAVRAALLLHSELHAMGVDGHLGVATGRVFTGGRGGRSRIEFAIIGASVVLAARLAALAKDVLCDASTRAACRKAVEFESLSQIVIKGKTDEVEVWRPRTLKSDRSRLGLVGRRDEQAELERRLQWLERDGRGGVVILEGEPGIGKTALVRDFLTRAQSHGVRSLSGAGDSIEQRTSYLAWRGVADGLLGADFISEPEALRDRLIERLGTEQARWLPLLNPLFSTSQPENASTSGLNAESRARTTRELLVTLLQVAARTTPLVIVLDDAHWMDSASWELAEQAASRVARLLLVISVRPRTDTTEALGRLMKRSDVTTIHLTALTDDETRELVCRRLEADAIPDELANLIVRRSEGHPFFAEELALALRDRGVVVVREGTCRLTSAVTPTTTQSLPNTVRGILATRIDQLPPQQQLTLKVAAVLGRRFGMTDLRQVHPLGEEQQNLQEQLAQITASGLLIGPDTASGLVAFSHALVQEVAYELLPYSQRRALHQQTAEWLERMPGRNLEELTPLLAHHWACADVADKAMHYLERAGEQALLRDSSNREAEGFLTRLLAFAATRSENSPARHVAEARWERLLAHALGRQGRHVPAMQHLQRSIALLGQRVPTPTLRCRVEFLRALAGRLAWRPPEARRRSRSETDQLALLELTRAYENYVQLLYLGRPQDDSALSRRSDVYLLSGVATLRSVRAAEQAGPTPELSRTYSLLANLLAMFGRPKLASHYTAQARAIAEKVGDRHALFGALTIGQLPVFIRAGWQEAAAALDQGLKLGTELRNVHDCLIYEGVLAYTSFNQGRLEEAANRFRAIRTRARIDDHLVPQLWAMVSLGEVAYRQGRLNDAITCGEECLELANQTETVDQNSRFQAHGLLASAWLRKDGPERAQTHVDRAMAAGEAGARLSYTPQFGFIGVSEVLFAIWERGGESSGSAGDRLQRWLRVLRLMALGRPILAPWDLLFRARRSRVQGRRAQAVRRLYKAVRLADRMSLACESGMARMELARLLGGNDAARNVWLDQACTTFTTMGAAGLLDEAQALRRSADRPIGLESSRLR